MAALDQLEEFVREVAERMGPSVVRVGRGGGRGAGVVLGEGLVVTNAHNLRGPQATIGFPDGRVETGEVAGVDPDGDLAVLRVATGSLAEVPWAHEAPALGAVVFALGPGPHGGGGRVTFGLVSALRQSFRGPGGRRIDGGLEHTAPLGRGSSGGPLVDTEGRLAGINTHRLGDGFYLALPVDESLRTRVDALARGEAPARRRLGVALAPGPAALQLRRAVGLPDRDGVLIRAVEDDSAADRAGLRQGDLLHEANGRPLRRPDDLFEALESLADDDALTLRLLRGVEEVEVVVSFETS